MNSDSSEQENLAHSRVFVRNYSDGRGFNFDFMLVVVKKMDTASQFDFFR